MKLATLAMMSILVSGVVLTAQSEDREVVKTQALCDRGDAWSCIILAGDYYDGLVLEQNYFKAKELSQRACDLNGAVGCIILGKAYENGHGVRQNKTEALKYFGKACDLKNQDGCDEYARLNTGK